MTGFPCPYSATKAVSNPATPRVTQKPSRSMNADMSAIDWDSVKRISAFPQILSLRS